MSSSSSRSSSLEVPAPVRGRRLTLADSKASVPAGNSTAAAPQPPQLDFDLSSSADSSDSEFVSAPEHRVQQPVYGYHAYSNSSLALPIPPPQPFKKGRFYSNALSTEDKAALIHGELNHNLKVWTPKDVVMHHEARKSLVPNGPGVDKLRKMDALASIERDKQHGQQALNRKATQSMYDLRSPSAPPQRPMPPIPTLARKFSFDATTPPPVEAKGIRPVSNGDYFSHRPSRPRSTLHPSLPASRSPSRARSPLSRGHRHNPSTTFDSMLAPHKSGKGEVFRGSPNAKEVKGSGSSADSSPGQSPVKDKKQRRFSKMPSMLSLKKRSSRYGLRNGSVDEDVPDVPALPEGSAYI